MSYTCTRVYLSWVQRILTSIPKLQKTKKKQPVCVVALRVIRYNLLLLYMTVVFKQLHMPYIQVTTYYILLHGLCYYQYSYIVQERYIMYISVYGCTLDRIQRLQRKQDFLFTFFLWWDINMYHVLTCRLTRVENTRPSATHVLCCNNIIVICYPHVH